VRCLQSGPMPPSSSITVSSPFAKGAPTGAMASTMNERQRDRRTRDFDLVLVPACRFPGRLRPCGVGSEHLRSRCVARSPFDRPAHLFARSPRFRFERRSLGAHQYFPAAWFQLVGKPSSSLLPSTRVRSADVRPSKVWLKLSDSRLPTRCGLRPICRTRKLIAPR